MDSGSRENAPLSTDYLLKLKKTDVFIFLIGPVLLHFKRSDEKV